MVISELSYWLNMLGKTNAKTLQAFFQWKIIGTPIEVSPGFTVEG
jgi:hypothetical protein